MTIGINRFLENIILYETILYPESVQKRGYIPKTNIFLKFHKSSIIFFMKNLNVCITQNKKKQAILF